MEAKVIKIHDGKIYFIIQDREGSYTIHIHTQTGILTLVSYAHNSSVHKELLEPFEEDANYAEVQLGFLKGLICKQEDEEWRVQVAESNLLKSGPYYALGLVENTEEYTICTIELTPNGQHQLVLDFDYNKQTGKGSLTVSKDNELIM